MTSPDSDALAYVHALGGEAKAEMPSSCRALPPFGILAAAVRALDAKYAAREDADDGIRLTDIARYRAEPGDVIVAYLPSMPMGDGDAEAKRIRERVRSELQRVFKDQAVLVSCGIGIEVVRAAHGITLGPGDSLHGPASLSGERPTITVPDPLGMPSSLTPTVVVPPKAEPRP